MNISIKSIELIREKLDISYKLAEKLLIKSAGDLDRAVLLYRIRQESKIRRMYQYIARVFILIRIGIENIFSYRLVITRQKIKLINIKFWIAVLVLVISFNQFVTGFVLMSFFLIVILVFTNCEIRIVGDYNDKSNAKFEVINHKEFEFTEKMKKKDHVVTQTEGYSEITIE